MSAEWEVQRALYRVLSDYGLTVYDAAPQAVDGGSTANWPYVEVGAIVFSEWDTKSVFGFNFVARLHTRSRSASMLEAKTIQAQIYALLHCKDLPVSEFDTTHLQRDQSFCDRMPDGSIHGVCEYRGMIEKA